MRVEGDSAKKLHCFRRSTLSRECRKCRVASRRLVRHVLHIRCPKRTTTIRFSRELTPCVHGVPWKAAPFDVLLRTISSFAAHHFIFCCAPFDILLRTISSFAAHHLIFCCAPKFASVRSIFLRRAEVCSSPCAPNKKSTAVDWEIRRGRLGSLAR